MPDPTPTPPTPSTADLKARKAAREKVKTLSLGAILLWAGLVWLTDLGWAAALIGVGAILVVEQAIRQRFQLKVDRFWMGAGAIITVGGVLTLAGINIPIGPLLLIAAGLAVISSIVTGRQPSDEDAD